ncbi:MAG: Gfo/Idh/MocA family oxidoreductase [Clostridiales bacterium]|nr:Gfo/Idh/MocA family oxidoreductase [Clostridiales bacterium]
MNIAIASFWHVHAKKYAKEIVEKTNGRLTAIWDEDPERGTAYAKQYHVTYYSDYDQMLRDGGIDGVVITSATSMHPELILKAIRAGKKVYSEKVLAITTADCMKIKKALEEKGEDLTLALVKKCDSPFLFAKQMVDSGALGRITFARMRNVHDGSLADRLPAHFYSKEQCGGGAMMDLGAHPMYLLNWILGMPKSVQSTFTNVTGHEVEDNAVSVLEYANGAIGISETGFVSVYNPPTFEISGTTGALLIRGDSVQYADAATGGQWVNAEKLPDPLPSPLAQWADGTKAEGVSFGVEDGILLTKVMEAAYRSQESGKKEPV